MALTRHSMELAVAAAITAFGGAIIAGSLQLSIGWASTGPQSGYFPFRLGVLLCITSGLLFLQLAFKQGKNEKEGTFATGEQIRRSLAMFFPTFVLVVAMPWAGCYVTSGLYLMYMARVHGSFSWAKAASLAVVLVVALYGLFDYWFMVPLAKGPIEAWLGIY